MFRISTCLVALLFVLTGCSKLPLSSVPPNIPSGESLPAIENHLHLNPTEPMGFMREVPTLTSDVPSVTAILNEEVVNSRGTNLFNAVIPKDEKDTTKVEPVFEPLVLAGTAAAVSGAALGIIGALSGSILLLVGAGLLVASAILTMIGWKRIKSDPKKYKGQNFAIANYIVIGVLGVAATFYFIYILFAF